MGHGKGHHGSCGYGMHGPRGMTVGHTCPVCGMPHGEEGMGFPWFAPMGEAHGPGKIAKIAAKKLLIEKVKAKMEARWGDKLDAIADEIVNLAEEKVKMKKEHWKRKKEMKERLHEILFEKMDEEE